ncbi:MAG: PDZ domain-containing protein [Holosporales bacterium]|jgi:serine protease Do|nr:PDZ domain-containing protein [Holosporales bacterium]
MFLFKNFIKKIAFLLVYSFLLINANAKNSDKKENNSNKENHSYDIPKGDGVAFNLPNFADIVKKINVSVVSIIAKQSQEDSNCDDNFKPFKGTPFEDFFKNFADGIKRKKVWVAGSGFIIKVNGKCAYIATNCHIVENASDAKILLSDKTEIKATVHGMDPRSDLAVLKIELSDVPKDKMDFIKALEWGNSEEAEVGHWVLAVGNPFGLGNTVTAGIISAKSRDLHIGGGSTLNDDFIQHSAQINVGNSGGCLINMEGKVIGINTVIITPSGGNVGIGFAIPAKNAKNVVAQLIEKQKIQRGALGIKVQDFTKEMAEGLNVKYDGGAVVAQVDQNGPAAKAGIKPGDIIVEFDGYSVSGTSKLSRIVGDANIDSPHKVKIIRSNKEIGISVKLDDFEKINGIEQKKDGTSGRENVIECLGMSLANASDIKDSENDSEENKKGAFVLNVSPDSPADDIGLAKGDIIEEVNQQQINSAPELKDAVISALKAGKRFVFLRVKKGEVVIFVSLRIDEEKKILKSENKKSNSCIESEKKDNDSNKKEEEQKKDLVNNKQKKEENVGFLNEFKSKLQKGFKNFSGVIEGFFNNQSSDKKKVYK